jgi:hypothetical protein
MSLLRPLRSTAVTRFFATMGLSDSQQGPTKSYLFLSAAPAPAGLPGSLTDLSTRAVPSHPEEPDDCFCPLLDRRFQASSFLGRLATPTLRHEAENGFACATARVFALQGFASGIAPAHARSATCRTGNLQDILLSEY